MSLSRGSCSEGPGRFEPPEGTIVIADDRDSLGLVFGDTAPDRGVDGNTTRIALVAVQVEGVPHISVERRCGPARHPSRPTKFG